MKILVFFSFLLTTVCIGCQQNSKPTKEEAIAYIENYFSKETVVIKPHEKSNAHFIDHYTFKIKGNQATISFEEYTYQDVPNLDEFKYCISYTFNINEIIPLTATQAYKYSPQYGRVSRLTFQTINNAKSIKYVTTYKDKTKKGKDVKYISSAYIFFSTQEDIPLEKTTIFQSLNHLRKVSGATK